MVTNRYRADGAQEAILVGIDVAVCHGCDGGFSSCWWRWCCVCSWWLAVICPRTLVLHLLPRHVILTVYTSYNRPLYMHRPVSQWFVNLQIFNYIHVSSQFTLHRYKQWTEKERQKTSLHRYYLKVTGLSVKCPKHMSYSHEYDVHV